MKKQAIFDRLLSFAFPLVLGMVIMFVASWVKIRAEADDVASNFHKLYYETAMRTWQNTHWMGVPAEKCPLDMWVYQEIIQEQRPDVIIEAGTKFGGTTLFLAQMCDLVNKGRIISIDIEKQAVPQHPRIKYLLGSSTSDQIVSQVKSMIGPNEKVLVDLDSDHSKQHVLNELKIYSDLVTNGSYLIVEDTNTNGHPVEPGTPGPYEAVQEFLAHDTRFKIDHKREKFYLTFNPGGYLLRVQ